MADGDKQWIFEPASEAALRAAFLPLAETPEQLPGFRLLKDNNARTVYRFDGDGRGFVVKRFKAVAGAAAVKERVLGHRAAREMERLEFLHAHGVAVPRPVASWADLAGESGLVTEEIRDARPLKELLAAGPDAAAQRRSMRDAAELVYGVHATGFLHQDLHLGNILVDASGRLHLIDVHRGRVATTLSIRDRLGNLAALCYSVSLSLPRTAWHRLLREYLALFGRDVQGGAPMPDARRCTAQVAAQVEWIRARHLRRRTRRCLRKGTGFHLERRDGWRIHVVRGIDPAEVLRVISSHEGRSADPATPLVKETSRVRLSRETLTTPDGERPVHVKAFRVEGLRLRVKRALGADPGKRAWVAAQGLQVRGLPTPEALAFVEPLAKAGTRNSYLVIASRPLALPLDKFVVENFAPAGSKGRAARDQFLRELADLVRRLHAGGVHHHDLKANNVLVRRDEGGYLFELIDLDRVSFARRLARTARLANLAQLNAATPGVVTRTDRLRWLRHYAVGATALGDVRVATAEIMRRTIARRHVWPPRS